MIKTKWFEGGNIGAAMERVDRWLEKVEDIEIVAVGQSQENNNFTITIFYKER